MAQRFLVREDIPKQAAGKRGAFFASFRTCFCSWTDECCYDNTAGYEYPRHS
jgi:hypothetical protein